MINVLVLEILLNALLLNGAVLYIPEDCAKCQYLVSLDNDGGVKTRAPSLVLC